MTSSILAKPVDCRLERGFRLEIVIQLTPVLVDTSNIVRNCALAKLIVSYIKPAEVVPKLGVSNYCRSKQK